MGAAHSFVPPWLGGGAERGIARFIDHTLLKPKATRDAIIRLSDEGRRYQVAAVCVNGCWVELCAERLRGSGVGVAAVVGFPLGAMSSAAKAAEARIAVGAGATEVDMVMGLGQAIAGDWDYVTEDIRAVVDAAGGALVKVILETVALAPADVSKAAIVARDAGAQFVKTSTGFHPAGGATVEAVASMRQAVGPVAGVKASGGIRTIEAAMRMLAAGANRIGTSSTAALAGCLGAGAPTLAELFRDFAPARLPAQS